MVKLFPLLFFVSILFGIEKDQEAPCNGEKIQKVAKKGLRSLKILEISSYLVELKNCKDKVKVKTIKNTANEKQLEDDAENNKFFVGRTSGCAYCVMALIVYLAFV